MLDICAAYPKVMQHEYSTFFFKSINACKLENSYQELGKLQYYIINFYFGSFYVPVLRSVAAHLIKLYKT